MNKYFLSVLAVSGMFLSGCVPGVSDSSGLSEAGVSKIVQKELKKSVSEEKIKEIVKSQLTDAGFATKEDVQQMISEKIVADSVGMTDEDFNAKVAAGIQAFIAEQEAAAKKAQEEANKPKKMEGISVDDDPFIGDADAPVTIVEFSDFECPFCSRHVNSVYPKIKEKYVDTGKVKYVYRDFPLGFHPDAMPAAVAANCVLEQGGNEKYFEMHDKLFANQKSLNRETFIKYAKELGLDEAAFTACLDANDTAEIEGDMKQGSEYGISGTPGFFINGWQIKGAYPYEEFEKYIEQELAAQE